MVDAHADMNRIVLVSLDLKSGIGDKMDEIIFVPGRCKHSKPVAVKASADFLGVIVFFQGVPDLGQKQITASSSEDCIYELEVLDVKPDDLVIVVFSFCQILFHLTVKTFPVVQSRKLIIYLHKKPILLSGAP
jgi:hypothetical protein